jgi:hypothetical protein
MKADLTNNLYKRYPILYRERNMTLEQSLMPWGFRCGDGWYGQINDLSADLERVLKKEAEEARSACCGVKQTNGNLRFEMSGHTTSEIDTLIERTKEKCMHTCEACGFIPAHMRLFKNGQQVLCNRHARERERSQATS